MPIGRWLGISTCLLGLIMLSATTTKPDSFNNVFGANVDSDDGIAGFFFTLTSTSTVTALSLSYAGGVRVHGDNIPAGGFDPILSLFQITSPGCDCPTITGNLISFNDNGGAFVPADPTTGKHFDSYLQATLPPGFYGVYASQYGDPPIGPTLADGFVHPAVGDNYTASGNCPQFQDSTGSCRTGNFEGEIIVTDASTGGGAGGGGNGGGGTGGGGGTPVAEPSSIALLFVGLASLTPCTQGPEPLNHFCSLVIMNGIDKKRPARTVLRAFLLAQITLQLWVAS
jgi:hypothetical protein